MANQALTYRRRRIEHVNSSVKDRIRLWKAGVRDLVMELCCAMHNARFAHFEIAFQELEV